MSGARPPSWPAPAGSAATRYKEITGGLNAAVAHLRQADAARAEELTEELDALAAEAAEAAGRERAVVRETEEMWEAALDLMWNEPWLTPPPRPEPAEETRPEHLGYLQAVAAQRLAALREVVRRRGLLRRR